MGNALEERAARFKRTWLTSPRICELDVADLIQEFSEVHAEGRAEERASVVTYFRSFAKEVRDTKASVAKSVKNSRFMELFDMAFEAVSDGMADFLERGGHLESRHDTRLEDLIKKRPWR